MLGRVVATIVFAILGLVGAQDNPTTPSVCATGCVNGVFVNAANIGCPNGDNQCVCNNKEAFLDGIRDCIVQACAPDGPDVQIPLAEAYGNEICADVNPQPQPTSSTAPPSPEATPTEAALSTTPTAPASTTTSVPGPETSSQSTAASTTASSTAEASSEPDNQSTSAPVSSSTTSASTTGSSSTAISVSTSASSTPTTTGTSQPNTTGASTAAPTGLSTAAKAGIGAGVGAAALAAIIIAVCVCLRRRQRNKTANRVRNYKISEPMSSSDRHFPNDIGRAETALPKPIITTQPAYVDSTAMATSPTSVYSSNSSDLEAHARRYEDMLPRTQPRTMI